MPKEVIYNRNWTGDIEAGQPAQDLTYAEVGWHREGVVQIAVLNPRATGEDEVAPYDPRVGWYMDLDRDGINRLIRALRRARDSAYGRDA